MTDDASPVLSDRSVLVRVAPEILALMKAGDVEPVVMLGVQDNGDGTHEMTLMRPDVVSERNRLQAACDEWDVAYANLMLERDRLRAENERLKNILAGCDDEAIERAARGIYYAEGCERNEPWEDYVFAVPVFADSIRRKALAALRAAGDPCVETDEQDPSAICGRLLVGQGSDTYDPLCVLPAGHAGVCKPERYEVVKMLGGTWNVRDAVTGEWVPKGIHMRKPQATLLAGSLNGSLPSRGTDGSDG